MTVDIESISALSTQVFELWQQDKPPEPRGPGSQPLAAEYASTGRRRTGRHEHENMIPGLNP